MPIPHQWLNYHHLRYFWAVAREGSVARASQALNAAQPTVSAQVHLLEAALGEKLLERVGRGLVLTDMGRVVFRYADEIFSLGRELLDTVRGRPTGRPSRLVVGVADVVPKMIAYRLVEPARRLPEPVVVVCLEAKPERLVAELAVHELDLVITDAPLSPGVRARVFTHLIGECGVTFFAASSLARARRRGFPGSLDGAPMLLPTANTVLRRSLDEWFARLGVRPQVTGEFEDSALLNSFGQAGAGLFAAPSAVESEVRQQHRVEVVGRTDKVRERFYAISVERRIKHPAVSAILGAARQDLFK